jgi:hypothetical protein
MNEIKVGPVMVEGRPSDAELAKLYRERLSVALPAICDLLNEALAQGLRIDFQIARDQFGRSFIQPISIYRPL